jgi:hypothetical protein
MTKEITLLHLELQLQPNPRPLLPLSGSVARSWLQNAKERRQTALCVKRGFGFVCEAGL